MRWSNKNLFIELMNLNSKKIYIISSCIKMQKSIYDVNVFKFPVFI